MDVESCQHAKRRADPIRDSSSQTVAHDQTDCYGIECGHQKTKDDDQSFVLRVDVLMLYTLETHSGEADD